MGSYPVAHAHAHASLGARVGATTRRDGAHRMTTAGGRESRLTRAVTVGVVAIGLALIAYQFAFNPSLSIDELAVVNNVLARDLVDLVTKPLDYEQIAPIGFLALVKASTMLFGSSETALRLVPMLAVLSAVAAFIVVVRREFKAETVPLVLALLLMARPLIWTPTLVKQYGLDIGVAAVLLWIGVQLIRQRRIHPAWLGGALLSPWLSHPAVFTLPAVAAAWALSIRRENGSQKPVASWTLAWGASSLAAITVAGALVTPATNQYMHGYWELAFWPLWPPTALSVRWPVAAVRDALDAVVSFPAPEFGLLLLAVGAWHLIRRNAPLAVLLLLPIVSACVVSAFRLYPFTDRTLYFLLPTLAMLIGAAFAAFADAVGRDRQSRVATIVAVLVAGRIAYLLASTPPPYHFQHIRPVLTAVSSSSAPGDRFLVTYGAEQAWRYYAPRLGLSERPTIYMPCRRGPVSGSLEELRSLDTGRIWLIFSMAARLQTPGLLLHELKQRGALILELPPGSGSTHASSAHLIDLDASPTVPPGSPAPAIPDVNPRGPCQGPAVARTPLP